MKNKRTLTIVLCALLLVLLVAAVFFIVKPEKSDIQIQIGIPSFDEAGEMTSMVVSPVLEDQDAVDNILLHMIHTVPVAEETVDGRQPDGIIVLFYQGMGWNHPVWLLEDSIILGSSNQDDPQLTQIHNDHMDIVPLLKSLIEEAAKN